MNKPITPTELRSSSLPHPVSDAINEAVVKLAGFRPTRIVGQPDMHDARAVQDDLLAICSIVDPIIQAIGDYAESNFGKLDNSLFVDQLLGAIEGQATFEVEQAGRRME